MSVCFRGGAGDSRAARSISAIRGLAKNMKAMSLKAKAAGGVGHARRRQRREADPRERYKDGSGATSAKIAPGQPQDDRRHDRVLHAEEDRDRCCSPSLDLDAADDDVDEKDDDGADEWVAEPEPGVLMTLAPRPDGTNRLRKVRFRDELFDDWAAQSWWADNHDRIVELYSLVNQSDDDAPVTPCQSESDGEEPLPVDATAASEPSSGSRSSGTAGSPILGLVTAPDTLRGCKTPPTVTSTPKAVAPAAQEEEEEEEEEEGDISGQQGREWVEEYEPGVFITVRAYPDHPLQLRHVELSRDKFGEVKARVWWQENKDRLRSFYSF